MLWWSLIAVCYGASLRGDSPSLVELKATTESPISILVTTNGSKTLSYNLDTNTSVDTLKEKLQADTGMPPDQQRILYGNKALQSGETLGFYGIRSGSILTLVISLR